jgi:glycine/D-amino acid oxidase-like deaminating enzyme
VAGCRVAPPRGRSRGAAFTDVVICERDTVGSGGTGKSSGVVRCHYGVSSLAAMANAGAVGVRTEEIDRTDVAALWPTANLDDFAAFAWEPHGGYGDAYSTAQAFAGYARGQGVRLRQHTSVTEVLARDGRTTGVRLGDGSTISAPVGVVAAGPWSVSLLARHGIELPITVHREQIVLIDPGTDLGSVPVFSDLVSLQYVRPEVSGDVLFGNSDLATLEPADPDRYSNRASERFVDQVVDKVSHRFPGLAGASIANTYAGCYDVTPDFNPVISATDVVGLICAAGFSGHGFKIPPAVGELVADLVTGGASANPYVSEADFRLSRFAEGAPLRSPHPYVGAGEMR